jgi:hypothetical protein
VDTETGAPFIFENFIHFLKKGIEFHPVERFDDVLALALPD